MFIAVFDIAVIGKPDKFLAEIPLLLGHPPEIPVSVVLLQHTRNLDSISPYISDLLNALIYCLTEKFRRTETVLLKLILCIQPYDLIISVFYL